MAVTASFSAATGILSVLGDNLDDNIAISRNAAGRILINGGAVAVVGGTPTVANTGLIRAFGLGGNDTITPRAASDTFRAPRCIVCANPNRGVRGLPPCPRA